VTAWTRPAAAASGRLAREWTALAARAAEPSPFAEHWFAAASLRHLAPGSGPRLLEVRRGDRLIGVGLLHVARSYGRMRIGHVRNWCHANQFLGTPLIARGEEARFWRAAIETLDDSDWAPNFLHIGDLVEGGPVHAGLVEAAAALGRACPVVHRAVRPLLQTALGPDDYYRRNIRSKRRGEHKRHRARLSELGRLEVRRLDDPAEAPAWAEDFLALEAAGWKGRAGSALGCEAANAAFFREVIAGAAANGRLRFLRMDLDGRPIAMLNSLLSPPGAFGFKSTFDERYARYSPGILLQIEQLRILEREDIAWTDSCAHGEHPTAALWSERRAVVRVTVRLAGLSRSLAYCGTRLLEGAAGLRRKWRR
jgi:CelD/BcsL family acetyltransferase involved in cellulose biosynthesis